jgi:hypothetical protein
VSETVAPYRVRPKRVRVVAWCAAGALVVLFTLIATLLSGGEVFQPGDQAAMIGLGVAFGAGILTMARPRIEADARGVRIRNVIGGYDLPWAVIRAVRFNAGTAWANLELKDDDVVSVMAIQRADKEHAVTAVRGLRALLERYGEPELTGEPEQAILGESAR